MPTTEQLALIAFCKIPGLNWHLIARDAQRPGGLERLPVGQRTETTPEAADLPCARFHGLYAWLERSACAESH